MSDSLRDTYFDDETDDLDRPSKVEVQIPVKKEEINEMDDRDKEIIELMLKWGARFNVFDYEKDTEDGPKYFLGIQIGKKVKLYNRAFNTREALLPVAKKLCRRYSRTVKWNKDGTMKDGEIK